MGCVWDLQRAELGRSRVTTWRDEMMAAIGEDFGQSILTTELFALGSDCATPWGKYSYCRKSLADKLHALVRHYLGWIDAEAQRVSLANRIYRLETDPPPRKTSDEDLTRLRVKLARMRIHLGHMPHREEYLFNEIRLRLAHLLFWRERAAGYTEMHEHAERFMRIAAMDALCTGRLGRNVYECVLALPEPYRTDVLAFVKSGQASMAKWLENRKPETGPGPLPVPADDLRRAVLHAFDCLQLDRSALLSIAPLRDAVEAQEAGRGDLPLHGSRAGDRLRGSDLLTGSSAESVGVGTAGGAQGSEPRVDGSDHERRLHRGGSCERSLPWGSSD